MGLRDTETKADIVFKIAGLMCYITNIYKSENMEITSKVLDPPTHEILEPKIIYTGL
jgi:hypothetical protein